MASQASQRLPRLAKTKGLAKTLKALESKTYLKARPAATAEETEEGDQAAPTSSKSTKSTSVKKKPAAATNDLSLKKATAASKLQAKPTLSNAKAPVSTQRAVPATRSSSQHVNTGKTVKTVKRKYLPADLDAQSLTEDDSQAEEPEKKVVAKPPPPKAKENPLRTPKRIPTAEVGDSQAESEDEDAILTREHMEIEEPTWLDSHNERDALKKWKGKSRAPPVQDDEDEAMGGYHGGGGGDGDSDAECDGVVPDVDNDYDEAVAQADDEAATQADDEAAQADNDDEDTHERPTNRQRKVSSQVGGFKIPTSAQSSKRRTPPPRSSPAAASSQQHHPLPTPAPTQSPFRPQLPPSRQSTPAPRQKLIPLSRHPIPLHPQTPLGGRSCGADDRSHVTSSSRLSQAAAPISRRSESSPVLSRHPIRPNSVTSTRKVQTPAPPSRPPHQNCATPQTQQPATPQMQRPATPGPHRRSSTRPTSRAPDGPEGDADVEMGDGGGDLDQAEPSASKRVLKHRREEPAWGEQPAEEDDKEPPPKSKGKKRRRETNEDDWDVTSRVRGQLPLKLKEQNQTVQAVLSTGIDIGLEMMVMDEAWPKYGCRKEFVCMLLQAAAESLGDPVAAILERLEQDDQYPAYFCDIVAGRIPVEQGNYKTDADKIVTAFYKFKSRTAANAKSKSKTLLLDDNYILRLLPPDPKRPNAPKCFDIKYPYNTIPLIQLLGGMAFRPKNTSFYAGNPDRFNFEFDDTMVLEFPAGMVALAATAVHASLTDWSLDGHPTSMFTCENYEDDYQRHRIILDRFLEANPDGYHYAMIELFAAAWEFTFKTETKKVKKRRVVDEEPAILKTLGIS